jgi:hypothetical protein
MKQKRQYYAHLTLRSDNRKVGPLPVSITSGETCPHSCPFYGNGCYAEYGPLSRHWGIVTSGDRGMGWDMFCDAVATLPEGQLWRHNAAGDLPGDGVNIDRRALAQLVLANQGKRGFTYTHYRPDNVNNWNAIFEANNAGFRVNLSADNLEQADELFDMDIAPVAVALPHDQTENTVTPKGRTVVVCPATQRDDVSCATCGLCQRERPTIVGFPAHGTGYKKVTLVARGEGLVS